MGNVYLDAVVRRQDDALACITNDFDIPITLVARPDVSVEADGIAELLQFVSITHTIEAIWEAERARRIRPFWGDAPGKLAGIVLTPDFHKGSGIPVGTVADARGFVVPRAVGNDVCCGMRLVATNAKEDEVRANMPAFKRKLREIFFQGKRDMKEEAPYAYKAITPVVRSVEDAGVARRVAKLWPIATVKG